MTAYAYTRGHKIEWDEANEVWRYADTGEPVNESGAFWAGMQGERPCAYCRLLPTPEGHDACLGELPGVRYACCGHGVEHEDGAFEGYICYERWPHWMTNKNRWPLAIETTGILVMVISSTWMVYKSIYFDYSFDYDLWGDCLILSGCIGLFARWVGCKQKETVLYLQQRRHEAIIKSLEVR